MASDMKGDVLREQPVQFTLLMLLGVGCCGIMAPVCCMWSRGLEASVLAFDLLFRWRLVWWIHPPRDAGSSPHGNGSFSGPGTALAL
mmetsp:Transcript_40534/g.83010  ORF Transcript_40534/g.83010 Transcript_40534/m.83010 type:complete len:87 (-) Transcript_40534:131-391(-)